MAAYLEWLEQQEETPLHRQITDTPAEYARRLSDLLPNSTEEINEVTMEFVAARYSRAEIQPEHPGRMRALLNRLSQALRLRLEKEKQR